MLIILLNRIYNCLFHLSSNCVVKGEGQRLRGTDRALQLKVVWDTSIFWRNDFVWCITFDIVNQACSQSSLVEFWSSRFIKNKIRKVKKNYRQCLLLYVCTYYKYIVRPQVEHITYKFQPKRVISWVLTSGQHCKKEKKIKYISYAHASCLFIKLQLINILRSVICVKMLMNQSNYLFCQGFGGHWILTSNQSATCLQIHQDIFINMNLMLYRCNAFLFAQMRLNWLNIL